MQKKVACVCLVFSFLVGSVFGVEAPTLVSIADSPDPFSPPVKIQASLSGEVRFSGTGPNVDNNAITQRTLLRMTVRLTATPDNSIVRSFVAETSAARNPGDPNKVVKTLTVLWDGKQANGDPAADGSYTYTVSAGLIRFHQNKQGPNTTPTETALAASNTLTGSTLLDATKPVITPAAPLPDQYVSNARPVISATFSDPVPAGALPGAVSSGVNAASARLFVDGVEVSASAAFTGAGGSYTPAADLWIIG